MRSALSLWALAIQRADHRLTIVEPVSAHGEDSIRLEHCFADGSVGTFSSSGSACSATMR